MIKCRSMMFVLLCFSALGLTLNGWCDRPGAGRPADAATTETMKVFAGAHNRFAINLLARWCPGDGSNVVLSVPTIWCLMAMVANGASSSDHDQIAAALGYEPQQLESINQCAAKVLGYYRLSSDMAMGMAGWFARAHPVNAEFVKTAKNVYGAEVRAADFRAGNAVGAINAWVADATHGKISSIVDSVPAETLSVFVSAAYLKAQWASPFREANTKKTIFNTPMVKSEVWMMSQERDGWMYRTTRRYDAVVLPYETTGLSMVVVLPSKRSSVGAVLKELSDDGWDKLNNGFHYAAGSVSIPRFRIEFSSKELAKDIAEMGGKTDGRLWLSNVTNEPVPIDSMTHRAVIDVDEKGTVAAAVTGMVVPCAPPKEPKKPFEFVADRPFLFFIVDSQTHLILFSGALVQPRP